MDPTRISTRQVAAGELPDWAMGVHWTDTNWTECRGHLTDPSWAAAMSGELSDDPDGIVLSECTICNACNEAEV
jgi:hypothetical protein